MTTIVSLAARDFIAVGCDSLATTSFHLVNPDDLRGNFFDANGNLKTDPNGKPELQNIGQIWGSANPMPVNQFPSVTKLYDLKPMNACALFAGASRIGKITIRGLVESFCVDPNFKKKAKNGSMQWLSESLRDAIVKIYDSEIPEKRFRPSMEIILSGYSAAHDEPEIWRLEFDYVPHNDSIYGATPEGGEVRYSPAQCMGARKAMQTGRPAWDHISTSFVERQNLTMRMGMRRFTRLTNGFSKKVENHEHALAIHYMHYNFARIHKSLRVTPAMEAGVCDHVWSVEEIVGLIESEAALKNQAA